MTKFDKNKYLRKIKFKRYAKYFYVGFLCLGCFILGIYFTYSKFSVSKDTEVIRTTVGDFISGDVVIGAYINGEYSKTLPQKSDGYVASKVVCDNNATGEWNYDEWSLTTKNITTRSKCNVYFVDGYSKSFDYTGSEQILMVPKSGIYRLEVWGAQGGSNNTDIQVYGGVGGYSKGIIRLNINDKLYINVGGKGADDKTGGYNGGGTGGLTCTDSAYNNGSGGGGATHIATVSGLLSSLEKFQNNILIVSGGGGGANHCSKAGSGGGISGSNGTSQVSSDGGNQTAGYKFGLGQNGSNKSTFGDCASEGNSGGGGGFYGGYSNQQDLNSAGGGGSGYIGNSLLKEKVMYCYDCSESNEESAKTISTTCSEETPTENCAKKGNGYAKITLISID